MATVELNALPAPLVIAAQNGTMEEGGQDPPFSVRYSGFVLGQGLGVLSGHLLITSPANQTASPAVPR